jgi:hypothetical protein
MQYWDPQKRRQPVRYDIREAVARAYTGWDRAQADRVIAWLDQCGYEIVKKPIVVDAPTIQPNGMEGVLEHAD